MSLRDLVRAVQQDLPITVRMERWMIANADPVYSEAAIKFSDDFLRGKIGGQRKTRKRAFRASGLGKCARARVFARIGHQAVSEQFSSTQANVFATGNALHMKWQMAGITEGWIPTKDGIPLAEVPLYSETYDLGGTADGFVYDGSLFEFKSINSRGYKWVASKGPEEGHKSQVGAYKLLKPDLTAASIVYENKDTGEWREYRVPFTDEVIEPVVVELETLRRSITERELPEIKDACLSRDGMEYRRCPFRETCLETKTWPKERAA